MKKRNSLLQIINSIDNSEENKSTAKNLGLKNHILKIMNEKMDVFKLSQLYYKIHNINKLSQDNTLKLLERAKVAMNKFKKLSQSENNANKNMQK